MAEGPLRVLLIEDNLADVRMIRELLAEAGDTRIHLEHADRLSAGLERLAAAEIHTVLLDLSLPDSQGLDTFRAVHLRASGVPIVVLTGFDDEKLAISAVQAGAQDYLVKGHVEGNLLARAIRYAIERKRAEEALRESEERLRLVIRATKEAVWTWNIATGEVTWNDAVQTLFGYRPDEVQPTFAWRSARIHPDDRQRVLSGLQTVMDRGEETWSEEYRFERKDRSYATVVDHAYVTRDGRGRPVGVVGAMMDVTQHRLLEEQFRQAQKMEAVGRLAGGIAHDFNNTLEVILGYSELMRERAGADERLREWLEPIQESVMRAAALTRQLLAFSRRQAVTCQVLDLNQVVAHMEKLLRRLIGEDVKLITALESSLGRIKADAGQIEQVLMNLAVNARDAMPQGGRLVIETANVSLDGTLAGLLVNPDRGTTLRAVPPFEVVPVAAVPPGDYVLLTVSDTGCGMDADTRSHLFEPFFTTKEPTKGTGLGLATVYGIVTQCGGHVEVDSEVGRGALFKIYLPRTEETVSVGPGRDACPGPLRGSETILVVEDDPLVRKLVQETLCLSGYTVLEAAHGEEAVQLCRQHQGPIHLLLTDMVLPGMNGSQLAAGLLGSRPELKTLFMSGYTDAAVVHHGTLAADTSYLQKPFTPHTLTQKVREVLDSGERMAEVCCLRTMPGPGASLLRQRGR